MLAMLAMLQSQHGSLLLLYLGTIYTSVAVETLSRKDLGKDDWDS